MNGYKKIVLFFSVQILLLLLLSSCGKIPGFESRLSDDSIRYIATAYNRGIENSFSDIKEIADSVSYHYDDNVLEYFKYFNGEISLETLNTKRLLIIKATEPYDPRIKNYIISAIQEFTNHSASNTMIDQYDEDIPTDPKQVSSKSEYSKFNPTIITSYEKREFLVDRVYKLIKNDYDSFGLFRSWYDEFYPGESFSDNDVRCFAKLLVDVAYTYVHSGISLPRLHSTSSDSYPEIIELSQIPVELLLAIAYQESRFFPGSYRAEIENENIYALSLGLTHILIDSDYLNFASENKDIGDNIKSNYTFGQISYYYLGNSLNSEDVFSDMDLLMIRGAFLYSSIYLDMIYQKFWHFFGVEDHEH